MSSSREAEDDHHKGAKRVCVSFFSSSCKDGCRDPPIGVSIGMAIGIPIGVAIGAQRLCVSLPFLYRDDYRDLYRDVYRHGYKDIHRDGYRGVHRRQVLLIL